MVLKQASIFGEYKQIVKKNNRKIKTRKNEELKEKITVLYALYEQLYNNMQISILEPRELITKNNIVAYVDEKQAEPISIINMNVLDDIDKRIEIMKKILRINE